MPISWAIRFGARKSLIARHCQQINPYYWNGGLLSTSSLSLKNGTNDCRLRWSGKCLRKNKKIQSPLAKSPVQFATKSKSVRWETVRTHSFFHATTVFVSVVSALNSLCSSIKAMSRNCTVCRLAAPSRLRKASWRLFCLRKADFGQTQTFLRIQKWAKRHPSEILH